MLMVGWIGTALGVVCMCACQTKRAGEREAVPETAQAGVTDRDETTEPTFVLTPIGKIDRVTLASGLVIEEMRRGSGEMCVPDATVQVRYSCRVLDGAEFDSTGAEAIEYDLRDMIRGWQEGLPGMLVGGVRRLTVPAELGYGARELKDSAGKVLAPANSVLVYEVELVGVR